MARTAEYQALLYACTQEGCMVCRLVQESTKRYLEAWKYELFTDVEVREELRRTQGFCHTHTWQLAHMGATLQLAQAYRDIVSDSVEQLQRRKPHMTPATKGLLQRLFETKQESPPCPACQRVVQAEARYSQALQQALRDETFYARFAASDGLCLEHFALTYEAKAGDTSEIWQLRLQQAQLACLQRLDEQLSELIRKHDYRFKDEERGPEMTSWKRAAAVVAGEEKQGRG